MNMLLNLVPLSEAIYQAIKKQQLICWRLNESHIRLVERQTRCDTNVSNLRQSYERIEQKVHG